MRLIDADALYDAINKSELVLDFREVVILNDLIANAPTVQQSEPFGYFKAEPFGWTDCAETDEGAIALYEAPTVQRDGWVSVPIEPTYEMLKAGVMAYKNNDVGMRAYYKAMIEAAPTDTE